MTSYFDVFLFWAHKTSLIQPLFFIEVSVAKEESERCVRGISLRLQCIILGLLTSPNTISVWLSPLRLVLGLLLDLERCTGYKALYDQVCQ
jgi:hypothetical protein